MINALGHIRPAITVRILVPCNPELTSVVVAPTAHIALAVEVAAIPPAKRHRSGVGHREGVGQVASLTR